MHNAGKIIVKEIQTRGRLGGDDLDREEEDEDE